MTLSQSMLPFARRLRDLLATIESTSLLGAAEARVRGLGEQLRFACLALPCSEALVALEIEALGRLAVPAVATQEAWRPTDHELFPLGTPFAYLLAGGSGYACDLAPDDAAIAPFARLLASAPRSGAFVPIRLGGSVIGGAALFDDGGALTERHVEMGERLASVLSLTVESFRTERVVFELFARALPDLLDEGWGTSLAPALRRLLHELRLAPAYRARLELAERLGRVVARGDAEARLAAELIERVLVYLETLDGPAEADLTPPPHEGARR